MEKVSALIERASKKGKTRIVFNDIRLTPETINELSSAGGFKIKVDGNRQLIFWGNDDGFLKPLPKYSDFFKVFPRS